MAYQYPLNGGRINASVGGNSTSAGAGYKLVSTGTLLLAGGNNITLSQNGSAITISGANAPSGSINFSGGTTSGNLNSIVFNDSNGVSFGLNGSTLTATVATNYAASNHSHGNPTLNLTNISGTTASASNGLTLSLSANAQTAQTIGMYATGANTTGQSSSNTLDARSFSISAQGGLYAGMSGNTLQLSAATNYAASNHSHGNPSLQLTNISGTTASASNGLTLSLSAAAQSVQTQSRFNLTLTGNTSGVMAQVSSGTLSLAGGNNITLSQNGNAVTISGASQSAQSIGGYASGNTTGQSSSSTMDARSLSVSALGGVSAGFSGGMMQLSGPSVSSLSQTGIVSISRNGNTISIGAPAFSAGMSTGGNTSGTTGTVSNQLIFAGGNNITLSQSTGAGGNTISIIGGAGGGGGGGIALANSQTTYTSGTANLNASGALTIASTTGQQLNFSVPATSMLSAGAGISISTNGSTVVFQAGTPGASTVSTYYNMWPGSTASVTIGGAIGATGGTAQFYPVSVTSPVAFNALRVLMQMSFATSTTSAAQSITQQFGLYTNNAGTLSLLSSNSLGYSVTVSSVSATVSAASSTGTGGYGYNSTSASTTAQIHQMFGTGGPRMYDLQFGNTMSITPGMYWLGMYKKESSSNAAAGLSLGMAGNVIPLAMALGLQSNANSTNSTIRGPYFLGFGPFSASSTAIPSNAAIAGIYHTGSVMPLMTFIST